MKITVFCFQNYFQPFNYIWVHICFDHTCVIIIKNGWSCKVGRENLTLRNKKWEILVAKKGAKAV